MPHPTSHKKTLLRIGREPFLIAQEGRCPLCGEAEWEESDPNETRYFSPTFDHVFPECRGFGFLGNALVVHNGCNSRKAKAAPLVHEIAVLRLVNARLGWDGLVYRNIPGAQGIYERIDVAVSRQGIDWMVEKFPPLMVRNYLLWKEGELPSDLPLPEMPRILPTPYRDGPRPYVSKGVLAKQRDRVNRRLLRPT